MSGIIGKAGHSAISGVVVERTSPAPERSRDLAKKTPHDIEAGLQRARSPDAWGRPVSPPSADRAGR